MAHDHMEGHYGPDHAELPYKDFEVPSSVVQKSICTETGKLAVDGCTTLTEYFDKDNVPTESCPGHKDEEEEDEKDKKEEEEKDPENTEDPDTPEEPEETTPTPTPTPEPITPTPTPTPEPTVPPEQTG